MKKISLSGKIIASLAELWGSDMFKLEKFAMIHSIDMHDVSQVKPRSSDSTESFAIGLITLLLEHSPEALADYLLEIEVGSSPELVDELNAELRPQGLIILLAKGDPQRLTIERLVQSTNKRESEVRATDLPKRNKNQKEGNTPADLRDQDKPLSGSEEEDIRSTLFQYDVFICHASEDKDEVARPLAETLGKAGLRVWYDEFTLLLGDSLRRKIDEGLVKSRYGIVIISPIFFKKDWTQKELDGLFARERNGVKVVLPVWHRVGAEDVARYSPMLSDRVAVSTKEGLEKVVSEVLRVVGYTAPREHKTTETRVFSNAGELGKTLQEAVTKGPLEIDIDRDMKQMFSEYSKTFTSSHFRILEFLDNPREYGERHGVKFGKYMAGGVSTILEEAIPELEGRREFYDQLVQDLYARGLVNIDGKLIHATMTESGMFAPRTTEIGRKFVAFVTKDTKLNKNAPA